MIAGMPEKNGSCGRGLPLRCNEEAWPLCEYSTADQEAKMLEDTLQALIALLTLLSIIIKYC